MKSSHNRGMPIGALHQPGAGGASLDDTQLVVGQRTEGNPGKELYVNGPPDASPWRSLRRRWLLALVVGLLLGGLTAAALWIIRPAKYTASALVRFDSERPELLPRERAINDLELYRLTQAALIKSPKVLDAALRQDNIRGLPVVAEQPDPLAWLDWALNAEPIRNTELLRLSLSGSNADEAATVVNAVLHAYLQEVVNRDQRQRFERLRDLKEVCEKSEEKLKTQRKKLRGVADGLKAGDQDPLRHKIAVEEYVTLRKELIIIGSELRQAAKLRDADGVRGVSSEAATNPVEQMLDDHPDVLAQAKKVAQAEETLAQVKANARPGFAGIDETETAVATVRNAMASLRARLRKSAEDKVRHRLEADAQVLAAKQNEREALLKEQYEAIRKEVEERRATAEQIDLTAMLYETERTEIEQADKIIKSLWAERERLEAEGRSSVQRVTVEVEATAPRTKSRKGQILVAGFGGLAAFLLGVCAITWWEFSARRIYSRDEVAKGLRLRVLGALPFRAGRRSGPRSGPIASPAGREPFWTETVNGFRTVLLHEANQHGLKVFMIGSAGAQEGKTTLASHLAVSMAAAGRRTLLIDADLRHPNLHTLFAKPMRPGLSDLLLGESFSNEAITPTSVPGLVLLPAGEFHDAVADRIAQGKFEAILEPLRSEYDVIVIDSSPILAVNDSLLIGQCVDAVVLSIRPDRSQTPMVHEACERLRSLDIPVLGTVLNGLMAGICDIRYPYVASKQSQPVAGTKDKRRLPRE